jgi:hypothetical protein
MTNSDKSPMSVWSTPSVEPLTDPDGMQIQDSAPIRNGEVISKIPVEDPVF